MSVEQYEVVVVGGGIVGMSCAYALLCRAPLSLAVLEAEDEVACHQSGRNSGVIHSGIYYPPGSLKALNCTKGREALYRFCTERGVNHRRCGKIIVATEQRELSTLEELMRRGQLNGLQGLEMLTPDGIRQREPHVAGIAGLFVPDAGVVDFKEVTYELARAVQERSGRIWTAARLIRATRGGNEVMLQTTGGSLRCRYLINCAGLHSDRVAQMCGLEPGLQVIPFRGEYFELAAHRSHLVNHLVYPVPDPRFPFLGVHLTRTIEGIVHVGPNAVLALSRRGYQRGRVSFTDVMSMLTYSGFWRMARRHWRAGLLEWKRSIRPSVFVETAQRLVPELALADLRRGRSGIRAQAVERDGSFVDDFRIEQDDRMLHVLNAPSPAATASLPIGEYVADKVLNRSK